MEHQAKRASQLNMPDKKPDSKGKPPPDTGKQREK